MRKQNLVMPLIPKKDEYTNTASVMDTLFEDEEKSAIYQHEYLDLSKIILNPKNSEFNFDDTEESIIEFASDIKVNGLLHNVVVSLQTDGSHLMISGERRYRAYQYLVAKGYPAYGKIYSQIREGLSDDEETLLLYTANLKSRGGGLTDERRRRLATVRLKELLQKVYNYDEKEIIDIISRAGKVSTRVVKRNIDIEEALIPELKDLHDRNLISKTLVSEYAIKQPDIQYLIYKSIKDTLEELDSNPDNDIIKKHTKATLADLNKKVATIEELTKQLEDKNTLLSQKDRAIRQQALAFEQERDALQTKIDQSEDAKEKKRLQEILNRTQEKHVAEYEALLAQKERVLELSKKTELELQQTKELLVRYESTSSQVDVESALIANTISNKLNIVTNLVEEISGLPVARLDNSTSKQLVYNIDSLIQRLKQLKSAAEQNSLEVENED